MRSLSLSLSFTFSRDVLASLLVNWQLGKWNVVKEKTLRMNEHTINNEDYTHILLFLFSAISASRQESWVDYILFRISLCMCLFGEKSSWGNLTADADIHRRDVRHFNHDVDCLVAVTLVNDDGLCYVISWERGLSVCLCAMWNVMGWCGCLQMESCEQCAMRVVLRQIVRNRIVCWKVHFIPFRS